MPGLGHALTWMLGFGGGAGPARRGGIDCCLLMVIGCGEAVGVVFGVFDGAGGGVLGFVRAEWTLGCEC